MALLELKTIADPVLYEKSEPVTSFDSALRELVRDMFDTMYEEEGVGLAAVQVGVLKRLLVIDLENAGHVKGVFINPELVSASQEMQEGEEGCLSVPGLSAPLARPMQVTVSYFDIFGNKQEITCEEIMARAILHEMDHLDGKVFIDLLAPKDRKPLENDIARIKSGLQANNKQTPSYRKRI